MKITVKQEKFCQAYIETGNAAEAYRLAYSAGKMKPESIHIAACKLLKDTKVSLRVDELRAEHRKEHGVTVDSLVKELEEARQIAIAENQSSAAVSATMGKAKLLGLVIEKNANVGKDGEPLEPVQFYMPHNGRD